LPLLLWLLAARKKKPHQLHQPLQLLHLLLKLPHLPLPHPHLPLPRPLLRPLTPPPLLLPPLLQALPSNSSVN